MPPETTDARIRAQAQKAVAPRAARWWLPASLAASFLIAVLVVQLQYGREEKSTVVIEADLAAPAASAPSAAAEAPSLARDRVAESPAAIERKDAAPSELHYEVAPEDIAPELEAGADEERITTNGTRVSGPEQERKAASEMDAEVINPPAPPPAESAHLAAERTRIAGSLAKEAAAPQRTPEAWYADIEALRKAGRNEEADAELARFEAAYPDWLEKNHLLNR